MELTVKVISVRGVSKTKNGNIQLLLLTNSGNLAIDLKHVLKQYAIEDLCKINGFLKHLGRKYRIQRDISNKEELSLLNSIPEEYKDEFILYKKAYNFLDVIDIPYENADDSVKSAYRNFRKKKFDEKLDTNTKRRIYNKLKRKINSYENGQIYFKEKEAALYEVAKEAMTFFDPGDALRFELEE